MSALRTFQPLIVFICLSHLIACSTSSVKQDTSMANTWGNSTNDFGRRGVHRTLTTSIIDTTPDDHLLQMVIANVLAKLPGDEEARYPAVLSLPKAQQAVYIVWWLEAEVNNGGYNQYYYNSTGEFAELAPQALRYIGASKFAHLTTKANAVYESEMKKILENQDGTIESFSISYDGNPLNRFDEAFYKLSEQESLRQILVDFIRKNKVEFVND